MTPPCDTPTTETRNDRSWVAPKLVVMKAGAAEADVNGGDDFAAAFS